MINKQIILDKKMTIGNASYLSNQKVTYGGVVTISTNCDSRQLKSSLVFTSFKPYGYGRLTGCLEISPVRMIPSYLVYSMGVIR